MRTSYYVACGGYVARYLSHIHLMHQTESGLKDGKYVQRRFSWTIVSAASHFRRTAFFIILPIATLQDCSVAVGVEKIYQPERDDIWRLCAGGKHREMKSEE